MEYNMAFLPILRFLCTKTIKVSQSINNIDSKNTIEIFRCFFIFIISPIISFIRSIKFKLLFKEVNGIQAGCLKTLQTRWEGRNKLSF